VPLASEPTSGLSLVPPRRYAASTFARYVPDANFPAQAAMQARLRRLAARAWLPKRGRPGLYLDGVFGVGKTHLLTSTLHAAMAPAAYLSLAELVYLVVRHGVPGAAKLLRGRRLLCIDEVELDDVASLHMDLNVSNAPFTVVAIMPFLCDRYRGLRF